MRSSATRACKTDSRADGAPPSREPLTIADLVLAFRDSDVRGIHRTGPARSLLRQARIVLTGRTQHEGIAANRGPAYWTVEGASLKTMLSKLYDMQTTRIELPASLDDDRRYDFLLVLPRDESGQTIDRLSDEFLQAMCDRLGLAAAPARRDVTMLVARLT